MRRRSLASRVEPEAAAGEPLDQPAGEQPEQGAAGRPPKGLGLGMRRLQKVQGL